MSSSLLRLAAAAAAAATASAQGSPTAYTVSDAGCAPNPGACRTLHGVGGLSGGGATSVLLPGYAPEARSTILDYLFKPNFGAALHILKVEIGGDAQSTDGAESSHMHNPWEENYDRGYEWMLMVEAKKRNPDIKLYGLSWAFPQWVTCTPGSVYGNCTGQDPYPFPDQLATYITKWVSGARNTYNLTIDYVGSWNERGYNTTYLKTLRRHLDAAGFASTHIMAPDSGWDPISNDILADPELAQAVWGIGAHYPGMHSSAAAEATGKPLWASEDDSTLNNAVGAGCWARLINRNYVLGNMTASINWNLVAAYTKGVRDSFAQRGLCRAPSPPCRAPAAPTLTPPPPPLTHIRVRADELVARGPHERAVPVVRRLRRAARRRLLHGGPHDLGVGAHDAVHQGGLDVHAHGARGGLGVGQPRERRLVRDDRRLHARLRGRLYYRH